MANFRRIKDYKAGNRLSATDVNDIVRRLQRLENIHCSFPLSIAESQDSIALSLRRFIPVIRRCKFYTAISGIVPDRGAEAFDIVFLASTQDYHVLDASQGFESFMVYDFYGDMVANANDYGRYILMEDGRKELLDTECP